MTDPWKSSLVQRAWKNIWIHGFVIGVGCVVIGVVVWFFVTGIPSPSTSHNGETVPQVQAPPAEGPPSGPAVASPAPVDSTAPLKSQLARVLSGITEANQKKDLPQLLSQYSPNFPQLRQRAQDISKTWKTYDYQKMDFEINEVKLLPDQTAEARVTWDVEAQHTSTLKYKNICKTYLIRFARESGQWRIKALDKAE